MRFAMHQRVIVTIGGRHIPATITGTYEDGQTVLVQYDGGKHNVCMPTRYVIPA